MCCTIFRNFLDRNGHRVIYLKLDDPENTGDMTENCRILVRKYGIDRFEYLLPDELRVDRQLREFAASLSIPAEAFDTEHYIASREGVREYFSGKKRYVMEPFYRSLRKKHSILMTDDAKPEGGKWNYDVQNRNPLGKSTEVPEPLLLNRDVRKTAADIGHAGIQSFGSVDPERFRWPVNREDALRMLDYFLEHQLSGFGTYQDAMSTDHPYLYHARISFALNAKILSPMEVVRRTLEFRESLGSGKQADVISIAQVEGFIRQILGWREYIRGIYWTEMPEYAGLNYFHHKNHLPRFYWTGETRMNCLRHAVAGSLRNAYAHHIQRLMLTGNFALQNGTDPDEVDRWYLGVYIDAVQWVELPNTRGMNQFADGGIVGSKPYVSSAAYINRMSNYCSGCSYRPKERTGTDACPFNSLYWAFYIRHRDLLEKVPRIGYAYKNLDRMAPAEQKAIVAQADHYRENADTL